MALTEKKPTVCHVLHSLHVGGAEMLAKRMALRFADSHRIILVCLDEVGALGEELRGLGFQVELLGRRPGLDWLCVQRFGAILRKNRVNLIHAHQYTPFFYSLLARWIYHWTPILFQEHGRHQPDYPRPKRIFANRILMSRHDRVVGVGKAVQRALIENEGIAPSRVKVIYNGIPLEKYRKLHGLREEVRAELSLGSSDLVLIQVARLDPIKDHATALQSFVRVLRQCPHAKFLIVGDGPERQAIEHLITSLDIGRSVQLLGTRHDVHRLLAASDIFLLTSKSEGIPLTLIEAMASGLPIVATDVGGVGEVVQDGVTGYLAPRDADRQLSEFILHLIKSPSTREQMGISGITRSNAQFADYTMSLNYHGLYQVLCKAPVQ